MIRAKDGELQRVFFSFFFEDEIVVRTALPKLFVFPSGRSSDLLVTSFPFEEGETRHFFS